jgi:stage V sporulation protein SpoVS
VRDNVAHCVTAMGDVSVATAVYAIALAREYLMTDEVIRLALSVKLATSSAAVYLHHAPAPFTTLTTSITLTQVDVFAVPVFVYVEKEGEQKTAVKFKLSWAPYGSDTTPSRFDQDDAPEVSRRHGGGGGGGGVSARRLNPKDASLLGSLRR